MLCQECGQGITLCDECQHPHDWYDHALMDHMCRWCLMSDYEHDPMGLPAHVRDVPQGTTRQRQVRIWAALQQLGAALRLRRRLTTEDERAG